jgi:hypothetical protein
VKQDDSRKSSSQMILQAFPKESAAPKSPAPTPRLLPGRASSSSPALIPLSAIAAEPAEALTSSLAGYRFVSCLERNPLGEVWKVQTPRGKLQIAQFLPPSESAEMERACERLQALAHRGLAPLQIVRVQGGPVVLLTDLQEQTLRERFQECWSQGLPGIPRDELLSYIRRAAATLDALASSHQIQHLALSPRSLLLQGQRLQISGFGLSQLIWGPARQPLALLNPRYAAPELWHHRPSWSSDQYSLGLIYAEMLTGVHPLKAWDRASRTRRRACPDLSLVSEEEREVLRRALHPHSSRRFANSSQMVLALDAAARAQPKLSSPVLPGLGSVVRLSQPPGTRQPRTCHSLDDFVRELVTLVAGPVQVHDYRNIRYTIEPGRLLEHHCPLRGFSGTALVHLDQFQQQWQARALHQEKGLVVFAIDTTPTFWQRLIGRQVGLEIQVQLLPATKAAKRPEAGVVIRPFGCSRRQASQLLADLGLRLLASVRSYLQVQQDQRGTERLLVSQPLRVHPVIEGVELAQSIDCVTKDVSATGIGFFLPQWLPHSQVYVNLPNVEELAHFAGLARIVRKQPCGDGWFEVGASFTLEGPAGHKAEK